MRGHPDQGQKSGFDEVQAPLDAVRAQFNPVNTVRKGGDLPAHDPDLLFQQAKPGFYIAVIVSQAIEARFNLAETVKDEIAGFINHLV